MTISAEEAAAALARAQRLYGKNEVESAIDRMAGEIGEKLAGADPLMICLMVGGIVATAQLATRLWFPLEIDYMHATRYRNQTSGGALEWKRKPGAEIAGRNVILIDDILDEGHTLAAAKAACEEAGAASVYSAVLVQKRHDRLIDNVRADFVGVEVDDRYVFGYGMDYKGYWRNLPDIYAVKEA